MTSTIGQMINNRYRIDAIIGDGGMGTVYRAYDVNLERPVALKLMHAHFARKEEFRARLVQEAKTAAQLDHPSIVRVYDFGESASGLFIAMEYVGGGSLRAHLRRLQRMQKYLPLSQSLQIAIQIADALDYAHRQGIIHRDVKPGNIILKRLDRADDPKEQPFRALLTDFGLVKLSEGEDITRTGTTLGTPTYMSPEQCRDDGVDGRTDIYSLGVVLYELVANQLPFAFKSLSEAHAKHSKGIEPSRVSSLRSDVPPLIDNILERALAKDPEERYQSAADMATAMRSASIALEGAPTQVITHEEISILDEVPDVPRGFDLQIVTPGHPPSTASLNQSTVTLGRHADNDIVLPAEGVSRHHARLQATSLGWELIDLGGINGTILNDSRLRAEAPAPVAPGSRMRIGPYELTLRGPELTIHEPATQPRVAGSTTPGLDSQRETARRDTAVPPLALFTVPDQMTIDPGQHASLTLEIVNQGNQDDRVSVRAMGVPPGWISTPDEFVSVPAGETAQLRIGIRPPRRRDTPTGRQRLRLELVSQRYPQVRVGETVNVTVGDFVAFEASLQPREVRLPAMITVSVQNTGNATGDFSVVARPQSRSPRAGSADIGLRIRGERGRIRLQPGQVANVELALEKKSTRVLGSSEMIPFVVEVASARGEKQELRGAARAGSTVPPFLLYALLFVVVFACVLGAWALLFSRGGFLGGGAALEGDGTATAVVDTAATSAAVEQTLAAATSVSATAAVAGDNDGDGISNAQEAILGTNPELADTDGDTLSDGREVLELGTDPLRRDSDGDALSDGDEVAIHNTDPTLRDTDGDGLIDSQEIAGGTNPLTPEPVTATATAELTPTMTQTPTVTSTPSISPTPSNTPTVTNTPSPTATGTQTTTPTVTATATSTATPTATTSATPTQTPSATPTSSPTATNTPLPNPALVCVAEEEAPPTIDGSYSVTEWPDALKLYQFQPDENLNRLVQVYVVRDANTLYMAFLINDNTQDASDSLRVYFDTTNNDGDPDTTDRFFQVGRDDSQAVWAGIGSNSDANNWNSSYTSTNWEAAIGEPGGNQWVVEMAITVSAEMGALADPFGLMTQVLYTGALATWPEGGQSNNPGSWQDVNNVSCP